MLMLCPTNLTWQNLYITNVSLQVVVVVAAAAAVVMTFCDIFTIESSKIFLTRLGFYHTIFAQVLSCILLLDYKLILPGTGYEHIFMAWCLVTHRDNFTLM
jgi:hypothetical protein